jgi:nitrite reductase/ring-hydroxylating ferredoxin subunit
MKWIKVFEPTVLQSDDFLKTVIADGKKLCAVKSGADFFFSQAYCPHAGAVLSGGWCKQGKLICPFHRYEYDLKTGRGAPGQHDYIELYPAEVREDGVYVGIQEQRSILKVLFGG